MSVSQAQKQHLEAVTYYFVKESAVTAKARRRQKQGESQFDVHVDGNRYRNGEQNKKQNKTRIENENSHVLNIITSPHGVGYPVDVFPRSLISLCLPPSLLPSHTPSIRILV